MAVRSGQTVFLRGSAGRLRVYLGEPPRGEKGTRVPAMRITSELRSWISDGTGAYHAVWFEIHEWLGRSVPKPPRRKDVARMADELAQAFERGQLVALQLDSPSTPLRGAAEIAPESTSAPQTIRDERPIEAAKTWVGLALVDDEGAPVPRRAYSLTLPDESVREGFFDARARVHIERLDPGVCPVTFPDLDVTDFAPPAPMRGGRSDGKGAVACDASGTIHFVEVGETLASIAERAGFLHGSTIWNRPENAALRRRRESPFVLFEGDAVFVPEKTAKKDACPTALETTFVVYREKTEVRLRARTRHDHAVPLDPATAAIDGDTAAATVAGDVLVTPVPRDGRALTVDASGDPLVLALGELGPIREAGGAVARLDNLGFVPAEALASGDEGDDEEDAERIELACELFQESAHKRPTGELNDPTIDALRDHAGA
jgi:hypothetical protein